MNHVMMSTNIPACISSLTPQTTLLPHWRRGHLSLPCSSLHHVLFTRSPRFLVCLFAYVHVGMLLSLRLACTDLTLLQHARYVLRFNLRSLAHAPQLYSPTVHELVRLFPNILSSVLCCVTVILLFLLITHPISQSAVQVLVPMALL